MKLLLESREDLSKVIQDIKNLVFKAEYGFEEKHSNFYHKTYRVIGNPYYVQSNPFSKNVYVRKIIDENPLEVNPQNEADHPLFFKSNTFEADIVFDLDLEYEALALLEYVNLIKWSDKVVREYIVEKVKKI